MKVDKCETPNVVVEREIRWKIPTPKLEKLCSVFVVLYKDKYYLLKCRLENKTSLDTDNFLHITPKDFCTDKSHSDSERWFDINEKVVNMVSKNDLVVYHIV